MQNFVILCASFSFIGFYLISINTILNKFLIINRRLRLLITLQIAPLLLGLIIYILYYLMPSQSGWIYWLILIIIGLITPILTKFRLTRSIQTLFNACIRLFYSIRILDRVTKIFIYLIALIIFIVFIRMIIWPVNWADQIFYIEQSYVFGKLHSLDLFWNWGVFKDNIISYQMNPAIRPGLPMIFSLPYLFNANLSSGILFAQTLMFYFFIILCCSVYYFSNLGSNNQKKSGIYALFFMLTTYLFINNSIGGFKEMIIVTIAILILCLIRDKKSLNMHSIALIGAMMGLASIINYSGIIISVILFIIILFSVKETIKLTIIQAVVITIVALLVGGFEFFSFYKFITLGLNSTNKQSSLSTIVRNTNNELYPAEDVPVAANEILGYNITNSADIYTKGKFQGLFQIEYYGFIFWIFGIIILTNIKKIIGNRNTRLIIVFIALYSFIIFDPFGLNKHQYSHVLSLSHKYTTLLVPLVAIVIGSRINFLKKILLEIKPLYFVVISFLYIILHYTYIEDNYDKLLDLIKYVVPIHQNPNYYLGIIAQADRLILYVGGIITLLTFFYFLKHHSQTNMRWRNASYSFVIAMITLFLLPFLFFFNTNFGLPETLKYTFSSKSVKLSNIKGWQGLYETVNYINKLPHNQKILFINQSIGLLEIHLDFPISNIDAFEDLKIDDSSNIDQLLHQYNYIFARDNSTILNNKLITKNYLKPVVSYNGDVLYKVEN